MLSIVERLETEVLKKPRDDKTKMKMVNLYAIDRQLIANKKLSKKIVM